MQNRVALAVAALLPLVSAFTVTISSNCEFPIYGWNVVDNYGDGPPTFTLNPGGDSWSSPFQSKTGGGGPSIKLQTVNSLFVNAEQTQIEYDMAGPTLFYDVSDVNGHPFSGSELTMQTSNPNCPTVVCPANEEICSQAYNTPDDLRTLACDGGADIQVLLCGASGGGSSGPSSSPSPAPPAAPPAQPATTLQTSKAPAPTLPPQQQQPGGDFLEESPDGEVEVVVQTTIIAVTSTVHVPAPTAGSESKREAHLHAHLHRGHSRVMGRHAH